MNKNKYFVYNSKYDCWMHKTVVEQEIIKET